MPQFIPIDDPFAVNAQTGQPLPQAQQQTYEQLQAAGGLEPNAQPGSSRFPLAGVEGNQAQPGQFYVDQQGLVKQQAPIAYGMGFDPMQKNDWPEDMARAGGAGIMQGGDMALGAVGDVGQMRNDAQRFANDKGGQGPLEMLRGSNNPLLANIADSVIGAQEAASLVNPLEAIFRNAPNSQELGQERQRALGADYQPQTTAGEYARTIGQFAPAAALPGGLASRVGRAVVPGAMSESAGQLTEGQPYEGAARMAGGLLGGGMTELAAGIRPPPQTMIRDALAQVSPEQMQAAGQLMNTARQQGVQLTLAEAVQQVTDGASGMGRLQRVVEGTRAGGERFAPMMAQRPGQVSQAANNVFDQIAPPRSDPSMIGQEAQMAAQGGLDRVRQQINAQAGPSYDNLAGQIIPEAEYAQLASNPAYQQSLANLRGNPILNEAVGTRPDADLSVVNEVVKRLDRNAEASRVTPQNPTGDNQLAAAYGGARSQADALASGLSGDWRQARDTVASGRQMFLDPLEAGPVGSMARTQDVRAQAGRLYPANPLEGASGETRQAAQILGEINPQVVPDLTRQHLAGVFNEATQNLQAGPNQWGGAKFASTVAGNPEQRAALLAGIEALPKGGDKAKQLSDLLQVLEATGKREAQGSKTAYNAEDLRTLGSAGAAGEATKAIASGPATFRKIGEELERFQLGRNANRISDILMSDPELAMAFAAKARQHNTVTGALAAALQGREGN